MPERKLSIVDSHLLLPSVRRTLVQLEEDATDDPKQRRRDEGLRKLAEHYAEVIDESRIVALNARVLVEQANKDDGLAIAKRMLNALVKYSEGVSTLSELGPKLQAALESLGASPKARAAMTGKSGGGGSSASPGESSLDRRRRLADERAASARQHGPASVDPSA